MALNLPFLICTCSVWDSYVICPNSNKVKIWLKKLHLPKLQRLLPRFYVMVAIAMPRSLLLEVHFRSVRKRKSSLMVKGIHKVVALFLCFPYILHTINNAFSPALTAFSQLYSTGLFKWQGTVHSCHYRKMIYFRCPGQNLPSPLSHRIHAERKIQRRIYHIKETVEEVLLPHSRFRCKRSIIRQSL